MHAAHEYEYKDKFDLWASLASCQLNYLFLYPTMCLCTFKPILALFIL